MENSPSQTDRLERGKVLVDVFVSRFDPSYRLLAQHAALPLALTPELLNYLHGRFLHIEVPGFEAEADLLLSRDLCREAGREQYVMDRDARAFLLDEMRREHGAQRMQEVAGELLEYVGYLARSGRALQELRAQEWAAMAYLDDHRGEAVREIIETFNQCFLTGEGEGPDVNRAEATRLSRLVVEELGSQLEGTAYEVIVEIARLVGQILAASGAAAQEIVREGWREFQIPGVDVDLTRLKKNIASSIGKTPLEPGVSTLADRQTESRRPMDELIDRINSYASSISEYQREEIESFLTDLTNARKSDSPGGETAALGYLGHALLDLGESSLAIECYEQALDAARKMGDAPSQMQSHFNLGRGFAGMGFVDRSIASFEEALKYARQLNDADAEMQAWSGKGDAFAKFGRWAEAKECYEMSLSRARALGDRAAEARSLKQLASVASRQGDTDSAIRYCRTALEIHHQTEDRHGESETLLTLGNIHLMRGEPTFALDYYHAVIPILSEIGDRQGEAMALSGLAMAYESAGELHNTIKFYEQALMIFREIGDRASEANVLMRLGLADVNLDELDRAVERYEQAFAIFREMNDRQSEAAALDNLGNALAAMARNKEAVSRYEQSLTIHRETGGGESAAREAMLLEKMALTIAPLGQREQAIAWAEDSLRIHEQFDSPDAERLREQIAKWRHPQPPATTGITLSTFEFETVTLDSSGSVIERRKLQARQFVEELASGVTLEMVEIPGGTFLMGSPESEAGSYDDERPQHTVTVSPFYMGKYQVTQRQWRAVASLPKVSRDLESDPSHFKGDDLPVERVSWEEAVEFCERLSKATEKKYRLPTEAEWEYACRAGTTTPFAFGETITAEIVNYDGNYPYASALKGEYRQQTVAVGSLGLANGFGLYDMHGNVWEWCGDWYSGNYYRESTRDDPTGSSTGSYRVMRGGSWRDDAQDCRSAGRFWYSPTLRTILLGFRLMRTYA